MDEQPPSPLVLPRDAAARLNVPLCRIIACCERFDGVAIKLGGRRGSARWGWRIVSMERLAEVLLLRMLPVPPERRRRKPPAAPATPSARAGEASDASP